MTIWNKIYKNYKDGEEYATLKGGNLGFQVLFKLMIFKLKF